jgi:ATP-dependent DNA helicase DinG
MTLETSPARALGADGPLARRIAGFGPRPDQQAMAEAVAGALENAGVLFVEAGTGTGKTFAYLVPALLSGRRVILSTGTRTLQDQLFHRDLPLVRGALGLPARVALLKGRANYLCLHRLETAEADGSPAHERQLPRIRAWAARTAHGDIAELGAVPEDAPVWARVTSTVESCLGHECRFFAECHVMKARRRAQEADVVVINHHLLAADLALKERGFGDLLPGADAVIIDEAHQFPEVAAGFFGTGVTYRQLIELARDACTEHQQEAGDMPAIAASAQALEVAAQALVRALGADQHAALQALRHRPGVESALEALSAALCRLHESLAPAAVRGKGLEACARRASELAERLASFGHAYDETQQVPWVETRTRSFALHLTPLDIAASMRAHMQRQRCAWVFTSATLAVGESFAHFAARIGVEEFTSLRLDSPFPYERNALLYVPDGLPDPASPEHTPAVAALAHAVLQASRGRAFLLFTSHRALREVAQRLEGRVDYPLLVQGSAGRAELLDRFRRLGNAVLLGTASFWEGVDVRGPALSCVIIDKLPFASPGEPVLQARLEALRARGGNPFMQEQVPHAVIALKQGVGRLIRDQYDRGVLVLCDPRLLRRPYGGVFLRSLPPMPRTCRLEDVQAFFAEDARCAPVCPQPLVGQTGWET